MDEQAKSPDPDKKAPLYDLVMLLYLLSGIILLPLVVGEILVAAGITEGMNEQTMPSWMYGYVVMTMYLTAFAAFVAWVPALIVCVVFWDRWRVVVPALAIIAFGAGLFLVRDPYLAAVTLNISSVTYTFVAFGIGLEWAIRRRL